MSVHISGTSPMSNFSCWVIVLESAFIIHSIQVSPMQANGPSPHAVSVRPSAASRAFDLWLHVSIEAFQFNSHGNFSRVVVQFDMEIMWIFTNGILHQFCLQILIHTSDNWEGKASQAFAKLTCWFCSAWIRFTFHDWPVHTSRHTR